MEIELDESSTRMRSALRMFLHAAGVGASVGTAVGTSVGAPVGVGVGSSVGVGLGSSVGSSVGVRLGDGDGDRVVGVSVGVAVGEWDGTSVGVLVGSGVVGASVGSSVGSAVGSYVGCAVGGSVVGCRVGNSVGVWLGDADGGRVVGTSVGVIVGVGVGCWSLQILPNFTNISKCGKSGGQFFKDDERARWHAGLHTPQMPSIAAEIQSEHLDAKSGLGHCVEKLLPVSRYWANSFMDDSPTDTGTESETERNVAMRTTERMVLQVVVIWRIGTKTLV